MEKSHYFVAPPPQIDPDLRRCEWCNRLYHKKSGRRKYCSKECYTMAHRKLSMQWEKDHIDIVRKRRQERARKRGHKSRQEVSAEWHARKKRNRVIKQELIYLELLTFQVRKAMKEEKLPWVNARVGFREETVGFVKDELTKLHLYHDQIVSDDRYVINWDEEYRKMTL